MTKLCFTVLDKKTGAYFAPFLSETIGSALRDFSMAVNSEKTQFFHHPEDFDLWLIGEYDNTTALTKNYSQDTRKMCGSALEFHNTRKGEPKQ